MDQALDILGKSHEIYDALVDQQMEKIHISEHAELAKKQNMKADRPGRILVGSGSEPHNGYVQINMHNIYHKPAGLLRDSALNLSGKIFGNVWQYSAIYRKVQIDGELQSHMVQNVIKDDYWQWRKLGMSREKYIRRVVDVSCLGYHSGHVWDADGLGANMNIQHIEQCDIAPSRTVIVPELAARWEIYYPMYALMVREHPSYDVLKKMLRSGYNLHILSNAGPVYEDSPPYNIVKDGSICIKKTNIQQMLLYGGQPFGHTYCLAVALMDADDWIYSATASQNDCTSDIEL
jgi:hypothetical protein